MRQRLRTRFVGLSAALHAAPFVTIAFTLPDMCPVPHGAAHPTPIGIIIVDTPLKLAGDLPRANSPSERLELPRALRPADTEATAEAKPSQSRQEQQDQAVEKQQQHEQKQQKPKKEQVQPKQEQEQRQTQTHATVSQRPEPLQREVTRGAELPVEERNEYALAAPHAAQQLDTTEPQPTRQSEPLEASEERPEQSSSDEKRAAPTSPTDADVLGQSSSAAGTPDPRDEQIVAVVAKINRTVPQLVPIAYVRPPHLKAAGIATVQFTLRRNGQLEDLRIVSSSGRDDLDRAARRVVALAQPYAYMNGWIEVTLAFFK